MLKLFRPYVIMKYYLFEMVLISLKKIFADTANKVKNSVLQEIELN